MILWAIIRNITWVVWLHLRSAHGLYLLWSWMYLLGSSYFACTVMVCFTHAQLWCASHWYRNPSAIENHSIYRLPRQMLVAGTSQQAISRCCSLVSITDRWTIAAGWKFASSPVCGLAHRSSQKFHPRASDFILHQRQESCLWNFSTLTGPFYSREKSRSWSHGVMVAALEFISWCEFISFSCRDQLTLVIFAVKKLGDSTDPSQRRDPFDFFPDFDEAMSIHRVMSNGFFSPLLILPMAIHQVSSAKGDDLCGLPWFLIYYVSQHSDFLSTTVWSGKMRCIFNMFFPFI